MNRSLDKSAYLRELRTHNEIYYAHERARNRGSVTDKMGRVEIGDYEPSAICLDARASWMYLLTAGVKKLQADAIAAGKKMYFIWFCFVDVKGLIPLKRHTVALEDSRDSPLSIIDSYRRGLLGVNYISVLEPALYASWSIAAPAAFDKLGRFKKLVSWHCHGLAWSTNKKWLKEIFKNIKRKNLYDAQIAGLNGCWSKILAPEKIAEKIAYMCKTPRKSYRLYCVNRHKPRHLWKFKQKKAHNRPGNHIDYFRLMRFYTMDQLSFGGGHGREILNECLQQTQEIAVRRQRYWSADSSIAYSRTIYEAHLVP